MTEQEKKEYWERRKKGWRGQRTLGKPPVVVVSARGIRNRATRRRLAKEGDK